LKFENGERELHKNPADETKVEAGDYLIMIANRQADIKLAELFKTTEGLE